MKQNFYRVALCVLMVFACTATYAQKKVLAEHFDDGTLPTGWAVSKSYWKWQNGEALFSALVENGVDTLFTPWVDVATLQNQPTLTIDYRMVAYQSRVNSLTLLYRTTTTEGWTALQTLEEPVEETERLFLPLPAIVTGPIQVAIAAQYLLGGWTAVDYVAIENRKEADEEPAEFRTEELTATSVTLRWAVNMSDYFVQNYLKVSTDSLTDLATETGDIFDGPLARNYTSLSDLQPSTTYYAYVRYECEDEDYGEWAVLKFQTPCAAVSLPYSEDFENGLSTCYTIVNNSKTAAANTSYPYNSTRAFQSVTIANRYNYLFFPEADVDLTGYQVTFMVASEITGNTYGREITVGVSTDATEENFTELKTISLPEGRRWEEVTISLAGYKGTGRVLAFRAGSAAKENHVVIDNITIEPVTACPKPMFVQATEITSNSAKLSWVEAGNATDWNLVLATREYNDPYDCEADPAKGEYAGAVSANPYIAGNLLPNTTYYAYLQAGCGSSEWAAVYSFTTQREVAIPYTEAFDRFDPDTYTDDVNAVPDMWVLGQRNLYVNTASTSHDKEASGTTYLPYISTAKDYTGSAYVPASLLLRGKSLGTSTYWTTSYAMMPAMPVSLDQLMLTFYAQSNDKNLKLVVGVANTQTNDVEQGQQLSGNGNVTPVDTLTFSESGVWEQKAVSFLKYAGTGKYITFWLVSATATPNVYIDDIRIDYAPDCWAVKTLQAEATGTTAATVTWQETLLGTSWKIKVSTTEIDPATTNGDVVANQTVSQTTYNLTGLIGNTTYYVYVSPACGDLWTGTTVTTFYAMKVPYYNDFTDEATGTGKYPTYWTTGNAGGTTSTSYIPYVYNTAWSAATGSTIPSEVTNPSLYLCGGTTTTGTSANNMPFAIMPELSNADVKDVTLSFWGHTNNTTTTNGRICRIGVLTDPTDITTLTPVTTVRLQAIKVSEYFVVDMSSYTGDGKYIVFYSDTTKTNYFMIDNLSVTLTASPQRVTDVEIDEIETDAAKVAWKENGVATQWNVRLFTEEPEDIDAATPAQEYRAVTANPLSLTGLDHSTQYYVYVQSVQGSEVGAWSSPVSFYTECSEWSLPFVENFDGYATGSTTNNTLHPCYDVSASAASNYPYVRLGSAAGAGTGAVELYGKNTFYLTATSTKKICQVMLPAFDQPIQTLQMIMDACSYSSYSTQSTTFVGIVTADGTFNVVATLELGAAKVWEEWMVDFSTYTGEEGRIAIRHDYDLAALAKTTYIFLDNIRVEAIPQCKKIQGVEAKQLTQTGATLSWSAAGVETAWNLKVSTTSLDDPSAATADAFDGQVTATTYPLTNLLPGTDYFVYVQSVRAEQNCVGDWSNEISFATLCEAMPKPYTENFDSIEAGITPACYTLAGKVQDVSAATTGNLTGQSQALKLMQVDKTYTNYCALPLVECNSVKDLQLTMTVLSGSFGTAGDPAEKWSWYFYEIGVMTDPHDPSTYVAVCTDSVAADGTRIPTDKRYTFDSYGGDEMGTMGKYIAIRVLPYRSSSGTEYSGTLYFDDITIGDKETCIMPTLLRVVEYSNDTVKLSWTAEEQTGTFRVRIFDHAEFDPDTDTPVAETTVQDATNAVLRGLTGNTIYYATVRRECGAADGNSRWSTSISWRSDCDDIQTLPYIDGFEGYTTQKAPNCWTSFPETYYPSPGGTSTIDSYVSASVAKDGEAGLYIGATTSSYSGEKVCAPIVTPRLDVTSFKDVLIYFDIKAATVSTAGGALQIEAVESPAEDAESILITTITGISNTAWQTVYLKLADYYTSVQPYQYLRFKCGNYYTSLYMDNLHITTDLEEVVPVSSLLTEKVTDNSATFSFVESTPGINSWIVEYGIAGFEPGTGTTLTVDTTTCTLTGLTMTTKYDVYVRSNVEGTAFVGPLTFTTIKPAAPLPYYYGFEDAEENAGAWTLANLKASGDPYPHTFTFGNASNVGGTGSTSLYIQFNGQYGYCPKNDDLKASTNPGTILAARYIDIPSEGTYTIGVKARCPGNPGSPTTDYMFACLVPASYTVSAGTIQRPDGTTTTGKTTTASKNEFNIIPASTLCGVSDYTEFSNRIIVTEPGIYQVVLAWYNSGVAANPGDIYEPVALDSVWVEEYECTTPTNHHLVNLSDTAVSIAWTAGKNTDFEVVLSRFRKSTSPDGMDAADKIVHETIHGAPLFTAKDLLPHTTYAFYMRTLCNDGPTDWFEFDFTTECIDESLPYTETFVEKPGCWILSSGITVGTKPYRTDEMEANGEEAEQWSYLSLPANGLAVLPDFGIEAQRLGISVATFNESKMPVYTIGVMTDPWDADTFEPVMSVQTKGYMSSVISSGTPYVLEVADKFLNLYQGTGRYLAIKGDPSNSTYIKYVTVTLLPECIAPQQVEVTDITAASARIHWLAGTEDTWEIACNGDTLTVNENPYTLTGLQHGQDYQVAVRALCDDNKASEWSHTIAFTTQCGTNELPLIENFESMVNTSTDYNFTFPNCWQQLRSTISLDSLGRQSKPATEVLETLPKQSTKNYYTYLNYKWRVPYQQNLDRYFNGRVHMESGFYQSDFSSSKGTYYKWLILPTVTVDASTQLTFDLAWAHQQGGLFYNPNNGQYNEIEPVDFRIIVSVDGGETFQSLQKIDLAQYDSTFRHVAIDLSDYAGQDIQVGFYHPMRYKDFFVLMPNICIADLRMNSTAIYPVEDDACEGYDYEGNGFAIPADSLPELGASKIFERFAADLTDNGSDSIIRLTLTTYGRVENTVYATICEGSSYIFGTYELTDPTEDGKPYQLSGTSVHGCDSIVYLYLSVTPAERTSLGVKYINEGGTYDFNGKLLSEPGTYYDTLQAVNGCDSIVSIQLVVTEKQIGYEEITICQSELPYTWKNQIIREAGVVQFDTLTTVGTDSVVYLTLTVLPTYNMSLGTCYINEGDTYDFNGRILSETGIYYDSLATVNGCDSVLSLRLIAMPKQQGNEQMSVCRNELPVIWKDRELTQEGIFVFDTLTTVGTDSVVNLTLTVLPAYNISLGTHYINEGETYDFFGQLVAATGTYYDTLQTVNGCDSVISVNIIVMDDRAGYENISVCPDELPLLWKGNTLNEAGLYTFDTLTTVGTDSIVYLTLTILPTYNTSLGTHYINLGDTYDFFGQLISATGTYYDTLQTVYGCDSVFSINIFAMSKQQKYEYMTVCQDELPVLWKERELTGSGIYTFDTLTTVGTDSAVILTLTVYPTYNISLGTRYINEGETFDFLGQSISESGSYSQTLQTANGCDSIISITIVAEPEHVGYETIALCENELPLLWKEQNITQAGTYRCDTLTKLGTDSVIYLSLTVYPTYRFESTEYINAGETYDFFGTSLAQSGDYTETLPTVYGCDSVFCLHLIVMPAQISYDTVAICDTDLPFVWKGLTINEAGTYTFDTLTTLGTDSVETFTLYVTQTVRIEENATLCPGDMLEWEGEILDAEGTYTVTYPAENTGCDSIRVMHITMEEQTVIAVDTVVLTTELPFVFQGEMILKMDTPEGIYDTTLVVPAEPCATLYDLHITVKTTDGISNVAVDNLNLYPTLIAVGEKVNLYLPEAEGITVTVTDMLGAVMAIYHPATGHLMMDDFYTAGIYLIRVTSADGYNGLGKIIAK